MTEDIQTLFDAHRAPAAATAAREPGFADGGEIRRMLIGRELLAETM